MNSTKIEPKYNIKSNPRIGLIALATDFRIEKDFINVIKDQDIDFFVNRIHCYFPLTSENLIKMSNSVTETSKDILPNEKLDCVVYGCTSGTIAAGYDTIEQKIKLAKPEAKVTTPSTAAINALRKMNINNIAIFFTFIFFRAFIAAVLGVVTSASGFAILTFFLIFSYPAAIVPEVHP